MDGKQMSEEHLAGHLENFRSFLSSAENTSKLGRMIVIMV
jgi:hypothetical protein